MYGLGKILVKGVDKMKLYKFKTTNCGVCGMLDKILEQVVELPPVESIDCEAQPEVAAEYGVFQVPTLILVGETRKEMKRHTGFMAKPQLESWVKVDD